VIREDIDFAFAPGAGDAMIKADLTMLEQALVNIFDNALKHGGDALTALQLASHREGQRLLVQIRNDGLPVPPMVGDRLFERFEQASPATSAGGAGLGLAIVSEICTLHGGTVTVLDDRQGFCLDLPVMPPV